MSKLFYVHIRVQGRKGYRDLAYVQNFAVFFFDSLPKSIALYREGCRSGVQLGLELAAL